jgi:hypothetical protein
LGHDLAEKWLKLQVLENLHFDKSNGNPRRYWGWRVFGQALPTRVDSDWLSNLIGPVNDNKGKERRKASESAADNAG